MINYAQVKNTAKVKNRSFRLSFNGLRVTDSTSLRDLRKLSIRRILGRLQKSSKVFIPN